MAVTIQSVQLNVVKQGTGGPYTVHIITYENEPYGGRPGKVVTRDVFLNSRDFPNLPAQAAALQVGQQVELTFVPGRNPKYKDLSNILPAGQQGYQQQNQAPNQQPQYQQQGQQQTAPTQPAYNQTQPAVRPAPAKPAYKARDFAAEQKHRDDRDDLTSARINRQTALKAAVEVVAALLGREGTTYKKTIKADVVGMEVEKLADQFEAYLLKVNGFADMAEDEQAPLPTEEPVFNPEDDIPY